MIGKRKETPRKISRLKEWKRQRKQEPDLMHVKINEWKK